MASNLTVHALRAAVWSPDLPQRLRDAEVTVWRAPSGKVLHTEEGCDPIRARNGRIAETRTVKSLGAHMCKRCISRLEPQATARELNMFAGVVRARDHSDTMLKPFTGGGIPAFKLIYARLAVEQFEARAASFGDEALVAEAVEHRARLDAIHSVVTPLFASKYQAPDTLCLVPIELGMTSVRLAGGTFTFGNDRYSTGTWDEAAGLFWVGWTKTHMLVHCPADTARQLPAERVELSRTDSERIADLVLELAGADAAPFEQLVATALRLCPPSA